MRRRGMVWSLIIAGGILFVILALKHLPRSDSASTDGIRLPNVAIVNEHLGRQWCLAFSPDGSMLACFNTTWSATGESSGVDVYEVATSRKLATLDVAFNHSLAFSPDGKTLATGHGEHTIRLWDTSSWRERVKEFPTRVGAPVFWLDDKTLATNGWEGQILCDLVSGKTRRITENYVVDTTQVSFAANGKLMVLAAPHSGADLERTIELWDVPTAKRLWSFEAHITAEGAGAPRCVAFAPDSKRFASGGGGRVVRIWDVAAREEAASYSTNRGQINCVAFSPDGKLLAAGDNATPKLPCEVLLWDVTTGERLGVWKTQTGVRQLAFSPDGKTLAVGSSWIKGIVELWSVEEMLKQKAK